MSANLTHQCTLEKSVSVTGNSLHGGDKVTLTLRPAPADHGLKFKRVDLPDAPTIDVAVKNAKAGERATFMQEGAVKVQTTEHVLSALSGLGVDNALIEMDANEPPIVDGSSRPYVEMILKAGIMELEAPRKYFDVREPIHVETKTGALLTVVPDSKFRISCTHGNHPRNLSEGNRSGANLCSLRRCEASHGKGAY
jgi:UDP-3-O-[3-hydroxymyristoyl] N-acetylglucosamine deacetylase/3-hydroxyacyl-[acyl-carrier-protein] dehydratase